MTMSKLSHHKPLLYGLTGLIAGAIAASLIVYNIRDNSSRNNNLRTEPLSSVNSTVASRDTVAKPVNSPQISPTSKPTAVPGIPGMMAHSDQHFIVMMIPHHEDAVAMADLALSRAKHPEIKALAKAIKTTQTQEIQQMQAWYREWYGTEVPSWSSGMGMRMGMHRNRRTSPPTGTGMMGRSQMGRGAMGTDLSALTNAADFDQEFLLQMIPHHQMAIMMSTMVANSATHPEIRNLAQSIIRSQSSEIRQMQQWYETWYPQ